MSLEAEIERRRRMLDPPADADLEREIESVRTLIGVAAEPEYVGDNQVAPIRRRVDAKMTAETGIAAAMRAWPTWQRFGVVVALSIAVTALTAATKPRWDIGHYPSWRMIGSLALLALLTAAASNRLLRPAHRPPPSVWSGRVLLLLGMTMPYVMSLWPHDGHVGSPPGEGTAFAMSCGQCLGFGGLLGIPVLLLAIAIRRAHVDGPAIAALAGIAAGLTGNLTLQVHCSITDPRHLLLGHATLLVIFVAFAAMWRKRWT